MIRKKSTLTTSHSKASLFPKKLYRWKDKYNRDMKGKGCAVLICSILVFASLVPAASLSASLENEIDRYGFEPLRAVENPQKQSEKTQVSFAAFTDTHIGARYQYPLCRMTDQLDILGEDLIDATNTLDFAVHLGDIVNHNTGQVNGNGLPWYVNQYTNNLKAFFISHINLPLYCVIGNHDLNDYEMNKGNPHNLTTSIVDELSMNNPVYAMMYDGILFLIVPELGCITWTHPVEYEWIKYMTSRYPDTTTIILCHQAIEDTTKTEEDRNIPYGGKQDIDWWVSLFQNNPQIKMWIHGHNHYPDWYVSTQSTGGSYPVQYFGHEMAFSSPYPQMNLRFFPKIDKTVIYNISATGIQTGAWENTGSGGHWSSGYLHSWDVATTFDPAAEDWYSFPMFLQDNETQVTDMKVFSPNITLGLIGTAPMELFFDPRMESPSGWANEKLLGFGSDRSDNIRWTNPGMRVKGPTNLTFPEKYPYDFTVEGVQEDGRSGQPYHSFPMGTICAVVPGQTYDVSMTARCPSGSGNVRVQVSCSDWGTQSQYSVLPQSERMVFSHTFGSNNETIHGLYTVPDDTNAWFLQGTVEFLNSTDYDVSLFSVKRDSVSETTDDFHLCLSGRWYNCSGPLAEHEQVTFTVDPVHLSDAEGLMNFTADIGGNRFGMANLIYHEPVLLGMNARFRVKGYTTGVYTLSLTKMISRNSAFNALLWDSSLFQNYPYMTELLLRFLIRGVPDSLLNTVLQRMFPDRAIPFKLFPFSTDPLYEHMTITADDGSGLKHISKNGNLWFSCNSPTSTERFVQISLPSS